MEHYDVLNLSLGAGSYGKVYQVVPKGGGTVLAVKQHRYFDLDSGFPLQTFKEIQLLKMVNSYETGEIKENKKHGQTLFERMIRQTNSVLPILEVCMLENTEYDPNMTSNDSTYNPMFIACTVHPFYPYDLAGLLYDGVIENFSIESIHGLMYQLAYKLMCIHKMNIVHRDIKPANILLREIFVEDESKPCYFLDAVFCDFGQATILPSDISIMKLSGFEYMQTTDYVLSEELKNINIEDNDENNENNEDISLSEESKEIEKLFREALTSASMTLGMHRVTPVCSTLVYRSPEQFINYPTWLLNGAKWGKNDAVVAAKCFLTSPSWKDQCCIKGNGRFIINQMPTPSLQNQDVFSLGCVFYELFSFNTNTSLERMNKSRYCRKIPHEYVIKPEDLSGTDLITSYINMGENLVKPSEESSPSVEEPKKTSIEYTSPIQELHALKQLLFSSLAEYTGTQGDYGDYFYYQRDSYGRIGSSTDKRQLSQLPIHPMISNKSARIGNKPGFTLGDHGKYNMDPSITPEMKRERDALRAFASSIHNRSQESVIVCSIINFIFTVLCLKYGIEDNLKKAFMKHLEKPHSSLSTSEGNEDEEQKPFWHFPITDEQTLMLAYIIDICNILRGYSLSSSSMTITEFNGTNTQIPNFPWPIADIAPKVDYSLVNDVIKSRGIPDSPSYENFVSVYVPRCASLLRQMLTSNAAERLTIKQVELRLRDAFSSHEPFINPNHLMTEEMTRYFLQSYGNIPQNSSAKTSIDKAFPFLTSHESSARSRCKTKLEMKLREQARERKQASATTTAGVATATTTNDNTKNINSSGRSQDVYNRTEENDMVPPTAKRDNWSNFSGNYSNYYQTSQRQSQQYPQQYNNAGYYNNYNQNYNASGYSNYNKPNNYNPIGSNNISNSESFRSINGTDGFIPPQGNHSYQRNSYQGRYGRGGYSGRRGYYN